MAASTTSGPSRPTTLAVVVSAGVSTYLPRTLAGLAAQTHRPEVVLLVDVGAPGRDLGTGVPLHEAVAETGLEETTRVRVVRAPEAETFGEAVRRGLVEYESLIARAAERARRREEKAWSGVTGELNPVTTGEMRAVGVDGAPDENARPAWLWLLHDDSAPAPDALDHLLRAVESGRSVALAGAKQRDWHDPDRLLEVGIRATRTARRVPDIEPGEIDQGQHDHREDVLAVGLAGALVRREVWDELGGTDPVLGPFGDGLELSRRVRLAGHRVVIVPAAVVHHARASYVGSRGRGLFSPSDEPDEPDPRRSYLPRRRAQLHNALLAAPAPAVPFLALGYLAVGLLRLLWRVATKEIGLAGAELAAPLTVLGRPMALWRGRRRCAAVRRIPARSLHPLHAHGSEIRSARRDARRNQAAARRRRAAPSELEIAERAALARRRRVTGTLTLLLLTAIGLAGLIDLLLAGPLTGGALRPADLTPGELWALARSDWLAAGQGHPGPADPLWQLLALAALPLAPFGGEVNALITTLVVFAVPLAGLGAWFAAGAASRSVALRAVAAVTWALAPALLLAAGQGRLGALVAHLLLPWIALGVARAVAVDRRDVILSGLVGARRTAAARAREERGGEETQSRPAVRPHDTASPESPAEPDDDAALSPDAAGEVPEPEDGAGAEAGAGDVASRAENPEVSGSKRRAEDADDEDDDEDDEDDDAEVERTGRRRRASGASRASRAAEPTTNSRSRAGSIAAAAGAALALAAACAAAPVLLPAAVVAVLLLAFVVPRRRLLLLALPLPAVVVLGPLLFAAFADLPGGSWRLLLGGGSPYPVEPGEPWMALLGWPAEPVAFPGLEEAAGAGGPMGLLAEHAFLAGGLTLLLGAVLALLRGTARARAVRGGWLVALVGLGLALVAVRVDVGLGADAQGVTQLVRAWAGPGVSLLTLGLLVAVVAGGDGLRRTLSARSFGWLQVGVSLLALLVVAGPLLTGAGWLLTLRTAEDGREYELLAVHGREAPPVPAVAAELQSSGQRGRVLALSATGEGVRAEVWREAGPQGVEEAAVVELARLETAGDGGPLDDAATELAELVAALAVGAAEDAAQVLGEHGIGVVLVPHEPAHVPPGTEPVTAERAALLERLDATAGLERVTENDSGAIWRVSRSEGAGSVARARILDADGAWIEDVHAGVVDVAAEVPEGEQGRRLVLTERADNGWRAWHEGRPMRATTEGWRQAFELPAEAGTVTVTYEAPASAAWRWAQAGVLGLTALLALPVRRRRTEMET